MDNYDICIVGGLGHIGLPLGISFANMGQKVVLYDINEKTRATVQAGKMPFLETGAQELLTKNLNKTLFTSNQKAVIAVSKFVVIVIGTPVDEHLNSQFTIFKTLFDELLPYLHDEHHIILRSTIFPGTTQKIKEYLAQKNKFPTLSFCPERIAQGHAIRELHELPQIVSCCNPKKVAEVKQLFALLNDQVTIIDSVEIEHAKTHLSVPLKGKVRQKEN